MEAPFLCAHCNRGPLHAIGSHATTMIALPKMMAAKMTASTSDTIPFN
jgi:hypothetical protein